MSPVIYIFKDAGDFLGWGRCFFVLGSFSFWHPKEQNGNKHGTLKEQTGNKQGTNQNKRTNRDQNVNSTPYVPFSMPTYYIICTVVI